MKGVLEPSERAQRDRGSYTLDCGRFVGLDEHGRFLVDRPDVSALRAAEIPHPRLRGDIGKEHRLCTLTLSTVRRMRSHCVPHLHLGEGPGV